MIDNKLRIGNFTSSEIVALTTSDRSGKGFGKPALTYIEECNMERRLGRSIDTESNAKPLVWGKFCESVVFELLGLEYTLCSNDTLQHNEFDCWTGTPDATKKDTVIDVKCPFTIKSFCQLVQPLYDGLEGIDSINKVRETHKDGEKYYWQLVSNAILTNSTNAELIVYCPYLSELPAIKIAADGNPDAHFIQFAQTKELPYLLDDGYYKNLNIIRFEVPQSDKDFLIQRVEMASELLTERFELLTA